MLMIIGMLLIAALIALIEVPFLLKQNLKKELIVFTILLLIGTGLCIAKILDIDIPSPLAGITFIYKPLSKFFGF